MEHFPKAKIFETHTSPLKKIYELLQGATTPLELHLLYVEEDQKLMKSGGWDYNNTDLVTNQVKEYLEHVGLGNLTGKEKGWAQETLWFWYHHAISCAIWKYKDKTKALEYSEKALELQKPDHPNKITKLFHLLIQDNITGAEKLQQTIKNTDETQTAKELILEYKTKGFF